MSEEEKYPEIREKLRSLETIKASGDFTRNLQLRIVEEESSRRKEHVKKYDLEKGGFLRNLFTNRQYPWLIPAIGFTAVIFFVFYITFLSRTNLITESSLSSGDSKKETVQSENGTLHEEKKETQDKTPENITENSKKPDEGNSSVNKSSDDRENTVSKPQTTENKKPIVSSFDNTEKSGNENMKMKKDVGDNLKEREVFSKSGDEKLSAEESPETDADKATVPEMSAPESSKDKTVTDEFKGKGLLLKLDKINKAGLESLRNKINN
ncbi:MAG: hypothetical protein JSS91_01265 [Bacteroidetes bacterium]|nr:hypothetical protein [Bacteroidota bacterium]